MHKFIYSITLTDGLVEHARFSEVQADDLPHSGVTAGGYTNPTIIVDQFGRITSAADGAPTGISIGDSVGGSLTGGGLYHPLMTDASGLLAQSTSFFWSEVGKSLGVTGTIATKVLSVLSPGSTVDLATFNDGTAGLRINKNAYAVIKKASAIADADLNAGEVTCWLDATAGTPVVNFKGKDSGGTVFSYTLGTLDKIQAPVADLSINSHKLTNVLDPTAAQDAATKNYVDTAVAALDEHAAVNYATAAALTELSYTNNGGVGDLLTLVTGVVLIDGQTMTVGDRVLIKNQASAAHNGIWTVTTVGALGISAVFTRATDFDQESDGIAGALVFVLNGTANEDTRWQCSASGTITWGTTSLNWSQFTGSTYSADESTLHLTGTTFSIKSTYVGQTSITTLGTIATGTWNATRISLTYIATAAANSVLLGSGASGSGASYSEIALGTGLTMTGTTLSASASSGSANYGGPDPITSFYPVFTTSGVDDEFDDGSFSGWTLVNDGTHLATNTETNNVLSILLPGSDTSAHLQAYMKSTTVNVGDIIEIAMQGMGENANFQMAGLIFADGTTYAAGNQVCWAIVPSQSNLQLFAQTNYNTQGTNTSKGIGNTLPFAAQFLRLKYVSANNFAGYGSCDGISWVNMTGTVGRTCTPSAVGFFVTTWGSTVPYMWSVRYFRKTT